MSACPKIEICPFFNGEMPQPTSTTDSMKEIYCRADYKKCARYQIAIQLGSNHVPDDLFPFEKVKVEKIKQQLKPKSKKRRKN